jgi:carotenoid cleavage dioxygenase-like enzyme
VAPLFPAPDGRPASGEPPAATLVRWTFDPTGPTDGFTERPLDERPGEFPRLDERFTGLPYRHGWFQAGEITNAGRGRDARDGLAHIDHASGAVRTWMPAEGDRCGEPVFVPRAADAAEGDGFVLSVIFRAATQCSDLAVFDAQQLADGPIALAHLSHRVPAGFHGNWRDAVR